MDIKVELIHLPITDIDRARDFYVQVGFTLDHDHVVSDEIRFVQLTPPGSACSIAIGTGLGEAPSTGPFTGIQAVIADADAARADLLERGIEVSEVQEFPWGRFVHFADPDGNTWSLQQAISPS